MKINWRTILLHLLFWVLYIVIWGVRDMAYAPTFLDTIDSNVISSLIFAPAIYVNLYLLLPKLLLKRKWLIYSFVALFMILLTSFLGAQAFSIYFRDVHLGTSEFFASYQGVASTAGDFLVVYGLATCLYLLNEWYIKERRVRELETSNLQSELDLLKSQVNPHFLFNALNSIHVLIRKDPNKAKETLEKFSELLSHQIYEVKKETIPLDEEIDNLKNFIEIQRLRLDDHVKIDWQVGEDMNGKQIAPMLFLNFVENAFKHASAHDDQVEIEISVNTTGNLVEFLCLNSVNGVEVNGHRPGVGMANARRRLEILYPETHELVVEKTKDQFSVKLALNLED